MATVATVLALLAACSSGNRALTPIDHGSPSNTSPPATNTPLATTSERTPPTAVQQSLWDVLASINAQMPLNSDGFSRLFGAPLHQDSGDAARTIWKGGPVAFNDGNALDETEVRVGPDGRWEEHGLAILSVNGIAHCVSIDDVRNHYPLSDPRPSSTDLETADMMWNSPQPWGRFTFSFDTGNPSRCLTVVTVRTP